jgi:hypothetical protein
LAGSLLPCSWAIKASTKSKYRCLSDLNQTNTQRINKMQSNCPHTSLSPSDDIIAEVMLYIVKSCKTA